jgi:hypothetical protein
MSNVSTSARPPDSAAPDLQTWKGSIVVVRLFGESSFNQAEA